MGETRAPSPGAAREVVALADGRRLTLFGEAGPASTTTSNAVVAAPSAGQRRYDPVADAWVTYADHRQSRTFLPSVEECPLCPTRPGGPVSEIPRESFHVAVFDNRFPALSPQPPAPPVEEGPYLTAPAHGRCEVVVYCDAHDGSLPALGKERVRLLVDVWADRYAELGSEPGIAYVMPFENRGEVVGVTLHHPHGQVYAYPDIPPRAAARLAAARRYHDRTGTCVHCDVVRHESADGTRVVAESPDAIAFVPFAARFPYEVQIAPRAHCGSLAAAGDGQRDAVADLLHRVLTAYDQLFGFPLPYVLAVQQEPTDGGDWSDVSHLHLEIAPPHRSAERLKYLAGSELAAGAFLGDVLPEVAAKALRDHLP
jgi:UDPglucose--hexose-1-phosphate uridylyltransferase